MSSHTIALTDNLRGYLVRQGLRESETARALRERTLAESRWHVMQISPEQGAFMALLVRMLTVRRAIEVGTFTGYSALVVAEALPEDGELIACDVSEEWTSIGKTFWARAGVAAKIDLRLRPALETLDALVAGGEQGRFDFAFIDADKANYNAYYERCLKLLRPGGVVAIDNVLWSGRVADADARDDDTVAIRALNARIRSDQRVHAAMLPIGDGLTLAVKR